MGIVGIVLKPKHLEKENSLLIVNTLVISGIVYAGLNTYRKHRHRDQFSWLVEQSSSDNPDSVAEPETDPVHLEQTINRTFTLSSLSLGLSMFGVLIYYPLGLVSVPLTLYTAIPTFEAAFEALFQSGRKKMAVVSTFAITGTMLTNHFFMASLIDWVPHYFSYLGLWGRRFNQVLMAEMADNSRQFLFRLFGGPPESVWVLVEGLELEIPFAQLEVGDIIVLNEGEIIPVDGLIIAGQGALDLFILTGDNRPVEVKPNDHVVPLAVVRAGSLQVQVEKIPIV